MTAHPPIGAVASPGLTAPPGPAVTPVTVTVPGNPAPPSLHELPSGGGAGPTTPEPARVHALPRCACGHGITVHDIRGNGTRGACFTISGPRGVRCACKNYEAAL